MMFRIWWTRDLSIATFMFYMSLITITSSSDVNRFPHGNNGIHSSGSFTPHFSPRPPNVNVIVQPPTSLPTSGEQNSEGPSSADFLCYNDQASVVIRDFPCPAESSIKVEVTAQFLNLFLKHEGGNFLNPAVSSVLPTHLDGYDLTGIETAEWMNYNRSDLSDRLEKLLQQLEENKDQLLGQLLQYLSSESLRNITVLTTLLVDLMNSTSEFKMCSNITNSDLISDDICNQLESEIEILNNLNLQAQKLLVSEGNSTNVTLTNQETIYISEDNSLNDNITDALLNVLIQRLLRLKEDSKLLAEFHKNLLDAINDFKNVVVRITKKFFSSILESGFRDISDKLFSAMLDVDKKIAREVSEDILDTQSVYSRNVEPTTEASVDTGINENTESYILSTQEFSSKAAPHLANTEDSTKPETEIGNLNHTIWSVTTYFNTSMFNVTQNEVQYVEGILEIAVALISCLSKLSELLNEGKLSESEQDEVLKNMTVWHNLRSRTTRDASGYSIASDRCQRQGTLINQTNFISLCSTCIHTTVLNNTYYPRYLTEKICSGGTSSNPLFRDGCLYQPGLLGGRPGGMCRQQEFHIIILQRVPGKCMKVVSQGQEIITDQWQSVTHALRIGCECVVDQSSQFAKYTHFP